MTAVRTTLLIFAAFVSHPAMADDGYLSKPPCEEVESGMRPPRPDEWCDYVKRIFVCDGDMAERLFRRPRNPAYLMPKGGNRGAEMPTRLRCYKDTFGDDE